MVDAMRETTFQGIHLPSLQPIAMYPEPLFKVDAVAVYGVFASIDSCRGFLHRHPEHFPKRYVRDHVGRRVRVLTAREVCKVQELRFQYGQ